MCGVIVKIISRSSVVLSLDANISRTIGILPIPGIERSDLRSSRRTKPAKQICFAVF